MANAAVAIRSAAKRARHPFGGPPAASCLEVTSALHSILEEREQAPAAVLEHVGQCLSCQAELARYRKLLRLMQQLRAAEVAVPPGIVGDVLRALEGAAGRRAVVAFLTGRRIAYGAAVAAAVGTGTVLVLIARRPAGAQITPSA